VYPKYTLLAFVQGVLNLPQGIRFLEFLYGNGAFEEEHSMIKKKNGLKRKIRIRLIL